MGNSKYLINCKDEPCLIDFLKLKTNLIRSTILLRQEDIQEIIEETGFTRLITGKINIRKKCCNGSMVQWFRFTSLDKNNQGYLTREDFLRSIVCQNFPCILTLQNPRAGHQPSWRQNSSCLLLRKQERGGESGL